MTSLGVAMRRMLALVPVFAVTGVLLSGCSPEPEPTPEPTAAFASEEEAFAAAEEVYRAYHDAYNQIDFGDPETFEPLDEFTAGAYQAEERKGLSQMYAEGVTRTGSATIVWFRGVRVLDDNAVVARACKDLSDVAIRDATGELFGSPARPDYATSELTFEIQASELFLVGSQAVEDSSCVSP